MEQQIEQKLNSLEANVKRILHHLESDPSFGHEGLANKVERLDREVKDHSKIIQEFKTKIYTACAVVSGGVTIIWTIITKFYAE